MSTGSTDLYRLWILRLGKEYDQISYTYRVRLKKPVIRVEDMRSKWGTWDSETRTLTLSTDLLNRYPWETVLEVFKHEIAHQMVTDFFHETDSHGPTFKKACEKLGVAEWASRSESHLLPETKTGSKDPNRPENRLMARAEKLLNLATSDNEHEALLAMKKVRELYAKYNLEKIESGERSHWDYRFVRLNRKRTERYQSVIASILNDHFFVEVIHTHLFDLEKQCELKALELMGTEENIKMAEYVFHFLENQLGFLWQAYRQGKKFRRASKNSFYLGVLAGFREKLEAQDKKELSHLPTLIKDPRLEAYVGFRHPRLVRLRSSHRLHDSGAYSAGRTHGKNLTLRKGISESKGFLGRFLPKGK